MNDEERALMERATQTSEAAIAATMRLTAEVERLSGLVPDTAIANASRHLAAQERANLAKRMRSEGMTVADIAKAIGRTERQTYRLLKP